VDKSPGGNPKFFPTTVRPGPGADRAGCTAVDENRAAPMIYTSTNAAGVRGSIFRWLFSPWTPATLVLVYILGSRSAGRLLSTETQPQKHSL
jgi:hypothetical protein